MTTSAPIACTLTTTDYTARLTWIGKLNRSALRQHRVSGRTLVLTYAPEAAEPVRELVRREEECCAFLHFAMVASADGVQLTIEAPQEAGDAAEPLFAPFLAGTSHPFTDRAMSGPQASASGPACDVSAPCQGTECGCNKASPAKGDGGGGMIASFAGKTGAVAAVACGVCCLLPFALPAVAVTSFGAAVASFGSVYWWAAKLAVLLVVVGWGWVLWQSRRTGRRAAPATIRAMFVATGMLGVALSWPYVEPYFIALVRR